MSTRLCPVLLALLLMAQVSTAERMVDQREALPAALAGAMVATDGASVYVFGGRGDSSVSGDILRLSPTALTVTKVSSLPSPRYEGCAAYVAARAYVFGGVNFVAGAPVPTDEIVEFDPATGIATALITTRLPWAIWGCAAASDGKRIYVSGGFDLKAGVDRDAILVFDPVAKTIADTGSRLPSGRLDHAAVYDGTRVVIVGGLTDHGMSREVIFFDPVTRSVSISPFRLPTTLRASSGVGDGGVVHLFGGSIDNAKSRGTPVVFRITTDGVVNLTSRVAPARWDAGAALVAGRAYIVGGDGPDGRSKVVNVFDTTVEAGSVDSGDASGETFKVEPDELPSSGETQKGRQETGQTGTVIPDLGLFQALAAVIGLSLVARGRRQS
ncbi:MAG: hypothetical protein HY556_02760 [Euryarchaeota archaeon]|nr:hypothetical protein [Euryarchaeota archaeon]